jgi:geranylgeranyl pyrophosphate synthase
MGSEFLTTVTFFTPVQDRILEVEDRIRAQTEGYHPELSAAVEQLLASGGKRVRPVVTLLTGTMLGAEPGRLVTLAAAVELLHTATLVHDDLIDGALLRRGSPTLNAQWSPAATVVTGDFIFARAAKLAAETDSLAVMHLFAETLTVVVNGEITQMFASRGVVSREDYFRRIYAKTASMFELAAGAAAELSPVDQGVVAAAQRFGYEVGIAFQIMDDVLDFTGEQATVGKPVASDLRQGLITLPALNYLESVPDDPDLLAVLNGGSRNPDRMNRVIESIRRSGAIDQSIKEARQFARRGINILDDLPASSERHALKELALYTVERHR